MSQIISKISPSTNYDIDPEKNFLGFFGSPYKKKKQVVEEADCDEVPLELDTCEVFNFAKLRVLEADVLADFAGFLLKKLKNRLCNTCLLFCTNNAEINPEASTYTLVRDKGGLTYPSEQLILATKMLELRCKKHLKKALTNDSFVAKLSRNFAHTLHRHVFPVCNKCRLAYNFSNLFVRCRTFFFLRRENKKLRAAQSVKYSSKSAHSASTRASKTSSQGVSNHEASRTPTGKII